MPGTRRGARRRCPATRRGRFRGRSASATTWTATMCRTMSDAELPTRFALAALATWRVTHLLAREDGPGDAVVRLRARLGAGRAGGLMDCFQCLSVWVAAPMSLVVARESRDALPTWLALSGAACLLERLGSR